jgi:hypothetical protein
MWYPILFLVIGVLVTALGHWVWRESDKPYGRENVEGIKTGLWYMGFGVAIMGLSIWRLVVAIQNYFSQ